MLSSSVVSDTIIGPIVRSNLLTDIASSNLVLAHLSLFGHLFSTVNFVELLSQLVQSGFLILRLFTELLGDRHDSRGSVSSSTRTVGLVYMLTTGTLRSHEVKSDVFHIH